MIYDFTLLAFKKKKELSSQSRQFLIGVCLTIKAKCAPFLGLNALLYHVSLPEYNQMNILIF